MLSGRVVASIPLVRTQIQRLRHGDISRRLADRMQVVGVMVAAVAVVVDRSVALGAGAVALLAVVQVRWMRRTPVPPATTIGIGQMVVGFAVVAATAVGVLASS